MYFQTSQGWKWYYEISWRWLLKAGGRAVSWWKSRAVCLGVAFIWWICCCCFEKCYLKNKFSSHDVVVMVYTQYDSKRVSNVYCQHCQSSFQCKYMWYPVGQWIWIDQHTCANTQSHTHAHLFKSENDKLSHNLFWGQSRHPWTALSFLVSFSIGGCSKPVGTGSVERCYLQPRIPMCWIITDKSFLTQALSHAIPTTSPHQHRGQWHSCWFCGMHFGDIHHQNWSVVNRLTLT